MHIYSTFNDIACGHAVSSYISLCVYLLHNQIYFIAIGSIIFKKTICSCISVSICNVIYSINKFMLISKK